MKQNKGVSMITLIITIIVIIILAAIAFVGMENATGSAQYSKFASEFGDYSTNFMGTSVGNIQESLSVSSKVANKAQIIYCAARKIDLKNFDTVLNGVIVPGGYTSTRFQTDIKDATGVLYVLADDKTPVYEIKDNAVKEYISKKFYGNNLGTETHWVTSTGTVFTLPGYPRIIDNEERMYITPNLYYLLKSATDGDKKPILAKDLKLLEPVKVGNSANIGNQKATEAADSCNTNISEEPEDTQENDRFTINGILIETLGDLMKIEVPEDKNGVQVWAGSVIVYKGEFYAAQHDDYISKNERENFIKKSTIKLNVSKGAVVPSSTIVKGDIKVENNELYAFRAWGEVGNYEFWKDSNLWLKILKKPVIDFR